MKQFIKVLVIIVVIGAAGFGIYTVLPEHPHNVVKSAIQPMVNSRAKELISQVQNTTDNELKVTYKTILEADTTMRCWVYETRDEEPGVEYVIFEGSGVSINLKDFPDYSGMLSTSCEVKFEFKISGNQVTIIPYIDGTKMYLDDPKRNDDNKAVRNSILQQLYSGLKAE